MIFLAKECFTKVSRICVKAFSVTFQYIQQHMHFNWSLLMTHVPISHVYMQKQSDCFLYPLQTNTICSHSKHHFSPPCFHVFSSSLCLLVPFHTSNFFVPFYYLHKFIMRELCLLFSIVFLHG
jgi:hypothetical protein